MQPTTSQYEAATFIVRLWRDPHDDADHAPPWRGNAVHVQSGTERSIEGLEALVRFLETWLEDHSPAARAGD